VSPLRSVEKIRKNSRTSCCPACGGPKAHTARECRRCWSQAVKRWRTSFATE
jgi:predicted amidophosphoribosyltransferase